MKITLEKLVNSIAALRALSLCNFNVEKTFKMQKLLKLVDEELKAFDAVRVQKIKLHEIKEPVDASSEKFKEFQSDMSQLLSQEITIPDFFITLQDFSDEKNKERKLAITPQDLLQLEWLIKDDVVEEKKSA